MLQTHRHVLAITFLAGSCIVFLPKTIAQAEEQAPPQVVPIFQLPVWEEVNAAAWASLERRKNVPATMKNVAAKERLNEFRR